VNESDLTVSQAAARLGISERTVQRRCKRGQLTARLENTPDGMQWLIDGATLPTGAAIGADTVPPSNHSQNVPNGATGAAIELLDQLKSENAFLRGLVEQRDRDAAELRASLRAALAAMPKALPDGASTLPEARDLQQVATDNAPNFGQLRTGTGQRKTRLSARKLTAWQRAAARILGIR